jgi:hypothetical protein
MEWEKDGYWGLDYGCGGGWVGGFLIERAQYARRLRVFVNMFIIGKVDYRLD